MTTKHLYMAIVALAAASAAYGVVAMAETVKTSSEAVHLNVTTRSGGAKNLNLSCMQAAVEKRDGAIITAVGSFHSTITSALTTHQSALKTAWGLTDTAARRTALKAAWQAYSKSAREARQKLKKDRNAAWSTFRNDRKACGTGAANEDGTNEAVDINL